MNRITEYVLDLLYHDLSEEIARLASDEGAAALPGALREKAEEALRGMMTREWHLPTIGYAADDLVIGAILRDVDFQAMARAVLERSRPEYMRRFRPDVRIDAALIKASGDAGEFQKTARAVGLTVKAARERVRLSWQRTEGYRERVGVEIARG